MSRPQERSSRRAAASCAIATGALYAVAEPPAGVWPLSFVCLAPLGVALRGRGIRDRAALGVLAGAIAAWGTSLAPAAVGLASFFDRSLAFGIAAGGAVGFCFGAIGFGVFAVLAGDPARSHPALAAWRFGAAFAAGEWLRSQIATGLPWLLLAHALAPAPRAAQLAAHIGVAGLGFALAAASGVAVALLGRGRRAAVASALALVAAFATADAVAPRVEVGEPGAIAGAERDAKPAPGALRVVLVQPATPVAWMSDATRLRERIERLVELSQRALPADLVVWPENAFGAALPANEALVREAVAALDPRPALLFGAPRYDPREPTRIHNAALLWDARGRPAGIHDKVRLLPFTEYVPKAFAALGIRGGRTAPGVKLAPLPLAETKLGLLICYELLFPALARELVAQGAGVLVNPSNDAWFGATAGGEQMLAAAVLRAIETRRALLRATPSGVTAAIDARGRIVSRLPPGEPGADVLDVWPVPPP